MKYENPKRHKAYRALALEIGQRIAKQAMKKRMSITQVAAKARVSQGNLCRRAAHGTCCLQLLALYRVASALQVSIRTILPPGGWA